MARLAEQYVVEMLNREGFATVQGVCKGVNEWAIFAIRVSAGRVEARHLEVQVSYDPVSYLSNSNAASRSDDELDTDMCNWLEKTFTGEKVKAIRAHFYKGPWQYELVHGELADGRELTFLRNNGVKTSYFRQLVNNLCQHHPRNVPFVAAGKDAVEIIRNLLAADAVKGHLASIEAPPSAASRLGI